MKLWMIYFTYGEHEMEQEVFVHSDSPRPSTADAREYLLMTFGGASEYMSQPKLLTIDGVYPFSTAHDKTGNSYKIEVLND